MHNTTQNTTHKYILHWGGVDSTAPMPKIGGTYGPLGQGTKNLNKPALLEKQKKEQKAENVRQLVGT